MNIANGGGLPQRTVLITGVSRGLGKALALEIAKRGHTVIGCSRSQENLNSLQADLSSSSSSSHSNPSSSDKHLFMNVDVGFKTRKTIRLLPPDKRVCTCDLSAMENIETNPIVHKKQLREGLRNKKLKQFLLRSNSSVEELARAVVEKKGVPDIIGTINRNNRIWEVPVEEFDAVIDTNIKGVANMLRHFIPLMIESKQGIIVNMSSGWGRSAAAQVAPYCASKWAVEGLTRSVAKELPSGMAIVALNPGVINTDMLASCFGSSAALYQTPESWAPKAATMILNLTMADNGASLTV
ncbi:hypothetical protein TEA_003130 [Camellia sinensis var. sinensis]|uniref:NADPH-dependent pterin aldehyde reductase n=1 Tax=Camellia sinensis var. sinensis TaxID=542762 RepID=A0A4S4DIF2_CAMSN|nr:hypothetical protein TEA_003130 [Camellia sinensis var. sinensis]